MKWLTSLFTRTHLSDNKTGNIKNQVGLNAYHVANDLFHNKKVRNKSVLDYYDLAIDQGIKQAYGDRAFCLQVLGYHYDALSDFTIALELNLFDTNLYFGRATSKKSIGDLEGAIEDLKTAISLAKIPNKENDELNKRASELGWKSVRTLYEMELLNDEQELEFNKKNQDISERLKNIKEIKRRISS